MRTPLQPDETANQANAKADESHDDESENQRIRGNRGGELTNPLNGFRDESSNISQNGSNSGSFSM